MFICGVWRARLCPIKQIWMIGTLSQLHENVLQSHFLYLASTIYNINVLHQDLCIPSYENITEM
jgi:hypothetical protein